VPARCTGLRVGSAAKIYGCIAALLCMLAVTVVEPGSSARPRGSVHDSIIHKNVSCPLPLQLIPIHPLSASIQHAGELQAPWIMQWSHLAPMEDRSNRFPTGQTAGKDKIPCCQVTNNAHRTSLPSFEPPERMDMPRSAAQLLCRQTSDQQLLALC
jgi:hypothetical protein